MGVKKGAHIICVLFNALASECVDLSEVVELTNDAHLQFEELYNWK